MYIIENNQKGYIALGLGKLSIFTLDGVDYFVSVSNLKENTWYSVTIEYEVIKLELSSKKSAF